MNLGEARSLLYDILADRQHTGCCCAACCYAAYHRSRLPKGRTYAKRVFFLFDLWRNCAFYLNFDREFRRRYEPKGRIKSFWISPDSTEYRAIGKLPDPKPGEPGYYDEYGYIQVRGWSPDVDDNDHAKFEHVRATIKNKAKRDAALEKLAKKSEAAYRRNLRDNEIRMVKDFMREVRHRTRSIIEDLMETETSREGKRFLAGYLNKNNFYEYYRRSQDPKFMKLAWKLRGRIQS